MGSLLPSRCFIAALVCLHMLFSERTLALATKKTALVTGSTDGIGVTTAKHLAAKGYNVIVHGRNAKRIEKACQTIRAFQQQQQKSSENTSLILSALADLETKQGCDQLVDQVQSLCQEHDLELSVLMNNAGVYAEELKMTPDGTEETFAVNVLAPFVITSKLLPLLLKSESASRIVIASSISQCQSIRDWDDLQYSRRSYSAHGAYSESKLLDAMLCFEMAERLKKKGLGTNRITCNCLDPGTVDTKMPLAGWGPCGIDVEDALDQTYLCTSEEVSDITGQYFTWKSPRRASSSAYDEKERAKMWKILSEYAPDSAAMWNFNWL